MAFDYKKEYKEFYLPPKKPQIITLPPRNFVAVQGKATRMTRKGKCDTKSRNVLRVNATLSIWSNPTVTCTGQKPALGSSQDNMGNLPA